MLAILIARRIFFALLTLLGAGLIVSIMLSLVPDFHLEKTFAQRAWDNIKTFVTFDFDYTVNGFKISDLLVHRSARSFILIGGAMFVTFLLGVPTGILAALKSYSRGLKIWTGFIYALSSLPILVWAVVILFIIARLFGIFVDYDENSGFAMKTFVFFLAIITLTLGDGMLSDIVRIVREETRKILDQDYIRAVRARNVSLKRHLTRSLIIPVLSTFTSRISYLISGTIVVEYVFSIKGLAYQIWHSVSNTGSKDYPFILAATMFFVTIVVLIHLTSDLAALAVDPRLRKATTE